MPGILLGLTSAAAGTYVLSKTLQNNKPVIVSVWPTVVSPGTELRIRGQNLFPLRSSQTPETVTVDIGGVQVRSSRAGEDVRAGQPIRLVVEGLPDDAGNVRVRYGSIVTAAETAADGVVATTVPPTLPLGSVDVKVGINGRWSDTFVLTLVA